MNGNDNVDPGSGWSRRHFLTSAGAAAGGLLVPVPAVRSQLASAPGAPDIAGSRSLKAAMHVHASWSEGVGSWEAQFAQAASTGFDLLYLTDHDFRAMAMSYLTSLTGVTMVASSIGALAQKATTSTNGALRLLAESSAPAAGASVTLAVQPKPDAVNRLRTSIAGLSIRHTVTSATLTNAAKYEVLLTLSYHPAATGRPAGQYQLVYRFGGAPGRWTENGGLLGVVSLATPAPGSVQTFVPEQDVAAIWPGMLAIDNALYALSFTARSPKRTAVADVRVASVAFSRTQNDAASVIANQALVVAAYQPLHPGLATRVTTEISQNLPDMNPFGIPPWLPDYTTLSSDHDTRYHQMSAQVHAMKGVIAYNHPFGYDMGPLLSQAAQDAKRRALYASMRQVNQFEADILEVGYAIRGYVNTLTHLALWDTFSRNGIFLTGNGTSDDHSGQGWKTLTNAFGTGIWAASTTDTDLTPALAGGRAFSYHAGRWPGAEADLLVDGVVRMGQVSVSTKKQRQMVVDLRNLPSNSTVQVVRGNADYSGATDPGTAVTRTFAASAFAGGPVAVTVDVSASRFFRVQVVAADGAVIGISNPVWLLRSAPPGGIPAARREGMGGVGSSAL
jgi:hypothetical protein